MENKENNEVKFTCPKCNAIIINPIWGCGWDWDYGTCSICGYDGELDTMTGIDPDGTTWQIEKEYYEDDF